MEKKKFNKKEYDLIYQKEHLVQFNVKMKREEKEEIDSFLKENNITQLELIKWGYKKIKERKSIKQIENKNIKNLFLMNDIIRLLITTKDDDFLKGKLSARDIYMLLDSSYENLKLTEIESTVKKLENDKIITKTNEEYYID